jgi:hypothetical protein
VEREGHLRFRCEKKETMRNCDSRFLTPSQNTGFRRAPPGRAGRTTRTNSPEVSTALRALEVRISLRLYGSRVLLTSAL